MPSKAKGKSLTNSNKSSTKTKFSQSGGNSSLSTIPENYINNSTETVTSDDASNATSNSLNINQKDLETILCDGIRLISPPSSPGTHNLNMDDSPTFTPSKENETQLELSLDKPESPAIPSIIDDTCQTPTQSPFQQYQTFMDHITLINNQLSSGPIPCELALILEPELSGDKPLAYVLAEIAQTIRSLTPEDRLVDIFDQTATWATANINTNPGEILSEPQYRVIKFLLDLTAQNAVRQSTIDSNHGISISSKSDFLSRIGVTSASQLAVMPRITDLFCAHQSRTTATINSTHEQVSTKLSHAFPQYSSPYTPKHTLERDVLDLHELIALATTQLLPPDDKVATVSLNTNTNTTDTSTSSTPTSPTVPSKSRFKIDFSHPSRPSPVPILNRPPVTWTQAASHHRPNSPTGGSHIPSTPLATVLPLLPPDATRIGSIHNSLRKHIHSSSPHEADLMAATALDSTVHRSNYAILHKVRGDPSRPNFHEVLRDQIVHALSQMGSPSSCVKDPQTYPYTAPTLDVKHFSEHYDKLYYHRSDTTNIRLGTSVLFKFTDPVLCGAVYVPPDSTDPHNQVVFPEVQRLISSPNRHGKSPNQLLQLLPDPTDISKILNPQRYPDVAIICGIPQTALEQSTTANCLHAIQQYFAEAGIPVGTFTLVLGIAYWDPPPDSANTSKRTAHTPKIPELVVHVVYNDTPTACQNGLQDLDFLDLQSQIFQGQTDTAPVLHEVSGYILTVHPSISALLTHPQLLSSATQSLFITRVSGLDHPYLAADLLTDLTHTQANPPLVLRDLQSIRTAYVESAYENSQGEHTPPALVIVWADRPRRLDPRSLRHNGIPVDTRVTINKQPGLFEYRMRGKTPLPLGTSPPTAPKTLYIPTPTSLRAPPDPPILASTITAGLPPVPTLINPTHTEVVPRRNPPLRPQAGNPSHIDLPDPPSALTVIATLPLVPSAPSPLTASSESMVGPPMTASADAFHTYIINQMTQLISQNVQTHAALISHQTEIRSTLAQIAIDSRRNVLLSEQRLTEYSLDDTETKLATPSLTSDPTRHTRLINRITVLQQRLDHCNLQLTRLDVEQNTLNSLSSLVAVTPTPYTN